MPMPAAAAAAAPTPVGERAARHSLERCRCYNLRALFFSAYPVLEGGLLRWTVTAHLRPRARSGSGLPPCGRGNPLPVWGARGRSARLFQRLLEQRAVGNHAVQVAPQRGQRGAEVAEREPAAQLGEPARVLLEEVREHGQRHQLEAAQVDHDALGRAAERSAHARDELPRRARVDGALEANHEGGARVVAPRPRAQPGAPHLHAARRHRPDQGRDERVPFVSTLVGAVAAGGVQVRSAWLRARARRDDARAAFVIRLEGAIDARAARKLVARVRRALGRTPERIVIDLGGLELVSLTVLTHFLEEHASRLAELRGRLAFRNLRPALTALRRNLHGMVPNGALLEQALEETS